MSSFGKGFLIAGGVLAALIVAGLVAGMMGR
jgi:hypothetical protein